MDDFKYYLGAQELTAYLRRNGGLDCTKTSKELRAELGKVFRCVIPLSSLVLAALFNGYAAIPHRDGQSFTFCRVSD